MFDTDDDDNDDDDDGGGGGDDDDDDDGLIFGRAYYRKDICIWDLQVIWGAYFREGLFFFGGGRGGGLIGILRYIPLTKVLLRTALDLVPSICLRDVWQCI